MNEPSRNRPYQAPLLLSVMAIFVVSSGCQMLAGGQNIQGVRDFKAGQQIAAEGRFRTSIKTNPQNADAHYNLAVTLHRRGIQNKDQQSLAEAEEMYHRCIDLNGDHIECHRELTVLLAQTGRSNQSFKLLKNWATRSPESPDARVELARLYEEFGDADTAEIHLHEALNRQSTHPRAHAALARLNERAGKLEAAAANYQQAYRQNRDPKIIDRLARLRNYSGARLASDGNDASLSTASGGWIRRY
ncbi:MAG: tetratricopeptide repeat protein [Pirellulaceae bacterium]